MSIQISGMDAALKQLEKLANQSRVEEIAKKAVSAAQPINERSMKDAIASSEHGPHATGSVSGSVSSTGTKVNAYGVYAVARPTGRDSKGERNGAKAAYLQYGVPGKLDARPWRENAVARAESECVKTMEDVIRSEMGAE